MANIKAIGIKANSPRAKKYVEDFLKVLPTLPKEEQEAVEKLKNKYKEDTSGLLQASMLDWAMSYLDSGILPTTSWDFEDMF